MSFRRSQAKKYSRLQSRNARADAVLLSYLPASERSCPFAVCQGVQRVTRDSRSHDNLVTGGDQIEGSAPHPLDGQTLLRFSWSHLIEFIRLEDPWKRAFYENECLRSSWSKRELQRQLGSLLYERTGLSVNKRAVIERARHEASEAQVQISELIRDPYVLEFVDLAEQPSYTESDLETALLDHLQAFLLELGSGFCFEARQRRITTGNENDFYLNYWKQEVTSPQDNPPVGLLLCSDKDQTRVEYAIGGLDQQLFVSRYLVVLPKANEIEHLIERDRALWERRGGTNSSRLRDSPVAP